MSKNRSPSFKYYELNQSPLYKLQSKNKLNALLGINKNQIPSLLSDELFNQFLNKDNRLIQHPIGKLELVHKKIYSLLNKIIKPSYLHSGTKKRSTSTNAEIHKNNKEMLKIDISKFFPSNSERKIRNLFLYQFEMSIDAASYLSKLICINGILPTGSQVSMQIAYFANKVMFDRLNTLAKENNLSMTAYVDDVAFSGEKIPTGFLKKVKTIVNESGLTIKNKKIKIYREKQPKMITGIIIKNNTLTVRNKNLRKIKQTFLEIFTPNAHLSLEEKEVIYTRLKGQLHAAGQINKRFKQKAKHINKNQKKYLKQNQIL
ncbi:reverse transcriptase family protein [Proteus terrae]|uniref:reverse transcriptase family protein n=1 Tax=Proteus terrae TaxID=1574161 RepID=UPI0013303ADE|nr:reverse transcriptase family protein [Proteus terrae]